MRVKSRYFARHESHFASFPNGRSVILDLSGRNTGAAPKPSASYPHLFGSGILIQFSFLSSLLSAWDESLVRARTHVVSGCCRNVDLLRHQKTMAGIRVATGENKVLVGRMDSPHGVYMASLFAGLGDQDRRFSQCAASREDTEPPAHGFPANMGSAHDLLLGRLPRSSPVRLPLGGG